MATTIDDILAMNPQANLNDVFKALLQADTAFSMDIKTKFKNIVDVYATKLSQNIKIDSISTDTLFGIDKEDKENSSKALKNIQDKVIKKIDKAVPTLNIEANLGSIFNVNDVDKVLFYNKYRNLTKNILNNLNTNLKNDKITLAFKEINLSDLFQMSGQVNRSLGWFGISKRYRNLIETTLSKLASSIKGTKFEFKEIALSDLFQMSSKVRKGFGLRDISIRYRKLITTTLSKLTSSIKGTKFKFSEMSLSDLFGVPQRMSFLTRIQYQKTLREINRGIKDKVLKQVDGLQLNKEDILGTLSGSKPQKKSVDYWEEMPSVIVNSFDKEAIHQLKDLLSGLKTKETPAIKKKEDEGLWLSGLLGSLGNTLLALLGFKAPIIKALTDVATKIEKWFGQEGIETAGKNLAKAGKVAEDVVETAVKNSGKITKEAAEGAGKAASKRAAKQVLQKGAADVTKKGAIEEIAQEGAKTVAKKGLFRAAVKPGAKIGAKTILNNIKYNIPLVGPVLGLCFGLHRIIKEDDWDGGLLEMASGVASIIPFIGRPASLALDAFLLGRDLLYTKEQRAAQNFTGYRTYANLITGDMATKILTNIPFVDTLVRFSKFLGYLSTEGIGSKNAWKEFAWILPGTKGLINLGEWLGKKTGIEKTGEMFYDIGSIFNKIGSHITETVIDTCFPTAFGIREQVKKALGLPINTTDLDKNKRVDVSQRIAGISSAIDRITKENENNIDEAIKQIGVRREEIRMKRGDFKDLSDLERDTIVDLFVSAQKELMAKRKTMKKHEDFISRPNQPIQGFSQNDTIIGFKNSISIKEGKDINFNLQKLQTLFTEVNNNIITLGKMIQKQNESKSSASAVTPPLNVGNFNYGREPAHDHIYNYRTKVWELLHGV